MSTTIWTADYSYGYISRGAGGGLISVAVDDAGAVWFKSQSDPAEAWAGTPVQVASNEKIPHQCHYDGRYVWVTDGSLIWRSADYGQTWEAV